MSTYNINLTLENIRTIAIMFTDIFIMWMLLHYVIRIVRSSAKTIQIFKGIILVLIVDLLSKLFGLKTVAYFADMFVSWGLLAFIIIFQPEIRSMLERLGKSNVFSRITTLTGNEKENLVDQIVTATMLLSQDQTGALISIEQSHTLQDFISTGTKLNSDVTAELLTSIFVTSTPLHDGAVIIQGDKIACASAYFPPTNLELPSRYGARHRAAIGISEITDAVTIVVSEETGAVSVTENGQIITVNRKQLRDYLLRVICGEEIEVTGVRKKNPDAGREVIIDDSQDQRKKNEETGVFSKLSLKKRDKKEEKIEVEEVVSPETDVKVKDKEIERLEEGSQKIKLPHKKKRPVPSYPNTDNTKRFEEEKRKTELRKQMEEAERAKAEEARKQQEAAEAERQRKEAAELERRRQEEALRLQQEKEAEQARIAKQAEMKRIQREKELRKQEEQLALRKQAELAAKKKAESEAIIESRVADDTNTVSTRRMTPDEVRAAREKAMASYSTKPEVAKKAPEPLFDTPARRTDTQFDTTKIDISKLMGMNNDLDKTFEMIDSLDSSSSKKKGGSN